MSTSCDNQNRSNVIFNWVTALPTTLYPFNIYFVKEGTKITTYMTDRNSNPYIISYKSGDLELTSSDGSITINGRDLGISQSIRDEIASKLQSVTGDLVDNTDPKNPVVNEKKDLPEGSGFFISATMIPDETYGYNGRYITYITDTVRTLDLLPYLPEDFYLWANFGVFRSGDNLYIKTEKDSGTGNRGLLALMNCKTVNNILSPEYGVYQETPEILRNTLDVPYNNHSEVIIGDFIYLVTRTEETDATNPTQIVRFNKNDITQYGVYNLPTTTGLLGSVGEAQAYGDWIYMLSRQSASSAYLIRIDKDLRSPEVLFQYGNTTAQARTLGSSPFVIDQDLIYIPTRYNSSSPINYAFNRFGIQVYSITTGKLIRSNNAIEISTGNTEGGVVPHWMCMYNGKLFVHTATSTATSVKRLVRIDPVTLLLDGPIDTGDNVASINIGYDITNNNTITPDGWIYLSPEGNFSSPLKRYRYEDFLIEETIIPTGVWSGGSLEYPSNPIKAKTQLSEFGEWDKVTLSASLNGGDPVFPDPITGNLDFTISSEGGGTWGSITGTLSDQTDLQSALNAKADIIVYPETAYVETVNWGGTAPVTMQNSTWQATKIGNRLSLRMNINYATAGTGNTTAQVPLPTGVPLPSSITGFTGNNSYVAVGSAAVSTSITGNPTISRAVLRRETGTTYSVYNSFSSGSYNTIIIDIEYFTD